MMDEKKRSTRPFWSSSNLGPSGPRGGFGGGRGDRIDRILRRVAQAGIDDVKERLRFAEIATGAPPPIGVPSQVALTTFGSPQVTTVDCPVPTAAPDTVLDNFVFNKSNHH